MKLYVSGKKLVDFIVVVDDENLCEIQEQLSAMREGFTDVPVLSD